MTQMTLRFRTANPKFSTAEQREGAILAASVRPERSDFLEDHYIAQNGLCRALLRDADIQDIDDALAMIDPERAEEVDGVLIVYGRVQGAWEHDWGNDPLRLELHILAPLQCHRDRVRESLMGMAA